MWGYVQIVNNSTCKKKMISKWNPDLMVMLAPNMNTNTFQPKLSFIPRQDPEHFAWDSLFLDHNNFNRLILYVITTY